MNVLLWLVQATLAFFYFAGGAYKAFQFDALAPHFSALSRGAWGALGVFEKLGAVLLVVPAATHWKPSLTPLAAAALTLETLGLAALYASYSLAISAENPLLWSLAMGALVALVAVGRYAPRPEPVRA
jgi:hypothetical protein